MAPSPSIVRTAPRSPPAVRARRVEQDGGEPPRAPAGRRSPASGEAAAGAAPDLPGAGDALAVGRAEAGGGVRVDLGEPGMQGRGTDRPSRRARFARARQDRVGNVREPVGQRRRNRGRCRRSGSAAVRRRAPAPSPPAPLRATTRHCRVPRRNGRHRGACGTRRFLRRCGARGEDAQLAVHLHGVGVDDRCRRRRSASSRARADLPLAVGPATIRAGGATIGAPLSTDQRSARRHRRNPRCRGSPAPVHVPRAVGQQSSRPSRPSACPRVRGERSTAPQASAVTASIPSNRPAKRAGRSASSQSFSAVRRRPECKTINAMPQLSQRDDAEQQLAFVSGGKKSLPTSTIWPWLASSSETTLVSSR